ncbi:MAG: hypothetical protein K0Q50_719 [Vampirovibrio sp.]|jgi:hypothetical protein|nr:hypothetical protein [Vampirovibrio sp.]
MIDDCIGKLLGIQQARGFEIPLDAVEEIGPAGAKHLALREAEILSSAHNDAPSSIRNQEEKSLIQKLFVGDGIDIATGIVSSVRNPSGVFGEEYVRQVYEFIRDHHAEYMDDLSAGRKEYFEGIKDLFDNIDVSDMSVGQQTAWDGYRSFYERGGELYGFENRGKLEKGISNLTGNIIKSSPTVILGNIGEGAIKLPTLYPKTFGPAIAKAWEAGITKKIPQLIEDGAYGVHYAGEKQGMWEGLIGLTDIPLKNIAYFAGELAEGPGGGARAVQRVSFTPRFGDLPAVYYTGGGRMAVGLLSYTINSYKMYADLWKTRNWQGLITYHTLAGIIGGGVAAGIPKPVEEGIKAAFPDSEQWFEENKGLTIKLIQPGNITRLAVPYDIAKSQVQRGTKEISEGFGKTTTGDMGGLWDIALGAMKFSSFTNAPVGDVNAQKILQLATDAARGDDAAVDEDLERLNPIKF